MANIPHSLELSALAPALASGAVNADSLLVEVYRRIAAAAEQPIFIELVPLERAREQLAQAVLRRQAGEQLPLFGVPFAVKDNLDVQGLPTTAACPAFAYRPERSATVVEKLLAAGAILIGKTNLDQFATGLVGVRSPYGACRSVIDAKYVSGGSSSGSAVAVALGLVSFALGTDTAGSGRVPAAFNNIVGLKPTRGLLSTRGLVPACRSLDCVSVFAHSVGGAWQVLDVLAGYDAEDTQSRRSPVSLPRHLPSSSEAFTFGVPSQLEFFGNAEYERSFSAAVERLSALGGRAVPVDAAPFVEAGLLLYGGPWVAERFAAAGEFIEAHREDTHPVVRDIILEGKAPRAYELFRAQYRLAELRRQTEPTWDAVDTLLMPTTGTIYEVSEVLREPLRSNANLGRYTNFVNLLDLAALALPAGFTPTGAPFGVTLLGPAFSDSRLAAIGLRFETSLDLPPGAAR